MERKLLLILSSLVIIFGLLGCGLDQSNQIKIGKLVVRFNLSNNRSINYDFNQVNSGSIFLKQNNIEKYHANLSIDTVNKTGNGSIENVIIGNYDVILELYDSNGEILYSGSSLVTIISDNQTNAVISLSKNIAFISITGNWTEEIQDLWTGILQLKKNGNVRYASNLILNTTSKTVAGGIDNLKPDLYDVYVEIKNSSQMVCFTGNQSVIINKGGNVISLTLVVKTGSVIIGITGDVSVPQIVSGPDVNINGQVAIITWITNENATSNICYSSVQGFNYESSTNWAPIGRDLSADTIEHSVAISGLAEGITYYYVIVTSDAAGNMYVSDEKELIISQTKFAVGGVGKNIYTSVDGGATWIERLYSGIRSWRTITSSTDGSKLAACDTNYGAGGYIYTSIDSGANWIEQQGSGTRLWIDIASSADGSKLAAAVDAGYLYTSADGGITWAQHSFLLRSV